MTRQAKSEFRGTDRFVIQRRLGAGSMGIVYEALDRERNTHVALKTLRHLEPAALYRLKNEFRALRNLEHPNLVSLGELIEAEGQWFFTMELLDGVGFLEHVRPGTATSSADAPIHPGSDPASDDTFSGGTISHGDTLAADSVPQMLSSEIPIRSDSRGPGPTQDTAVAGPPLYDEQRLRAAAGQLAVGLVALHAAGKVHRDIKPANIRVTRDGRVVLLDFGLIADAVPARKRASDRDGGVVGTIAYMAPEQSLSGNVGPEADWYSFGVVLYEALTGRLPFGGRAMDVLEKKQHIVPTPPRAWITGIAPDLDALCCELLRIERDERPGGSEVLRWLGVQVSSEQAASASTISWHAQPALFIGREREYGRLREAFDDTRAGRAVTVSVHGESGLGKSELIRQFTVAIEAELEDAVVLTGRCYEREAVPYKAFDGVIDALSQCLLDMPKHEAEALVPSNAALLPRVFPVLGRVEVVAQAPMTGAKVDHPHELRHRVFAALRELLTRLATRRPLIIVIDDLQWADAESNLLLDDLMRPPDVPPFLLLASFRTEAQPQPAPLTVGASDILSTPIPGDVRPIDLQPLDHDSAVSLARALLKRADVDPDVSAQAIAVEAVGHPLYIDELVRHAAATGERGERPMRLDEAIWARVRRLPESAVHILQLLSLAGAPLPQGTLCDAAEMDASELSKLLSLLRIANLVRAKGGHRADSLEPYHDRVREAVLTNLASAKRVHAHTRLGIALESAGAAVERPELLLRHLEAAGRHTKAAHYAVEAARRADEAFAFDRAAELYRSALRLGEYDIDRRRELRIAFGDALGNAGRGTEAADAFLEAAEDGDPVTQRECQTRAAEHLLVTGHFERGLDVTRVVLAGVGITMPATSRRALVSMLWQRVKLALRGTRWTERHEREILDSDLARLDVCIVVSDGFSMVDPFRGAAFMMRALLMALKLGEPVRVGRCLGGDAMYRAMQGGRGLQRSREVVAQMQEIAERHHSPYLTAGTLGVKGFIRYVSGDFRATAELTREAEDILLEHVGGFTWALNNLRLFRLLTLRGLGSFRELRRLFDAYVRDAVRRGDRYAETSMKRGCNLAWLAADDPAAARHDLDHTNWQPPADGYHVQQFYEWMARVELALYEGAVADRFDDLSAEFGRVRRSLLMKIQVVRIYARSVWGRLCVASADNPALARRGLKTAARCARRLEGENLGYARVLAQPLRAAVALGRGDRNHAIQILRDGARLADDSSMAHLAATLRWRLGGLLDGDSAAAARRDAETWMKRENVRDGARLVEVFAPGFQRKVLTGGTSVSEDR